MSTFQYCHRCGAPLRPDSKFCGQCGQAVLPQPETPSQQPTILSQQPVYPPEQPTILSQQPVYPPQQPAYPPPQAYPPQQPAYPPQQPAYPPQQAYPPPAYAPPRPRSRRRGGLGCLFVLFVLVVLLACAGGLVFWGVTAARRTLTLAARTKLLTQTVSASGGEILVSDPNSEVNGLKIVIPAGAYARETQFTISTRPIKKHRFGELFDPITPLITVDNKHGLATVPMTVEIPIRLGPDEFAMAFFWDRRTGKLEGIPLVDLTTDKITLITAHFSDLVVSRVKVDKLGKVTIDTGFVPGIDDWQFTNYGTVISPDGHCAGQSLSMMWYYYEKRLGAGERPLYGRYDNNNYGLGTIDFDEDDSWGYRLASVVQQSVDWDTKSRMLLNALGRVGDNLTWNAFAYSMALTGEPQYVTIARYEKDKDGNDVRHGHALVAYKIDGNSIYVADPNYPGQSNRSIRYENGAFLPYSSGDNANDIAANGTKVYTEIRYMAKSALVDWERIGVEYEKMRKGQVGQDVFPAYVFSVLRYNQETKRAEWQIDPQVIEIDEAETALVGEKYRGKLYFSVAMASSEDFQVTLYDGTKELESLYRDDTGRTYFTVPLTPGVHDLGFYIGNIRTKSVNGQQVRAVYDNDFRRVKVIYERPDLSGTWEGTYRVRDAGKARQYIEDVLVQILLATGLAKTESEARAVAAAAIVQDPNLYNDRPIRLVLEAIDPEKLDRYRATVYTVADDGTPSEVQTEATFKAGIFKVKFKAADGSQITLTGQLDGQKRLVGSFDITAWGIVKNALTGEWEMKRIKD